MFQARRVKVRTYSRQMISAMAALGLLLSSTVALPAYAEESGSKDTASKEPTNKAAWQQLQTMMRHRSADRGDGNHGRYMHANWRHQQQFAHSHHHHGSVWAVANYRHGSQWARNGFRHGPYWASHNFRRGFGPGGPAWAYNNYRHGRSAWARPDFYRGPGNHDRGGPPQFARWNHHRSHHGDSQFAGRGNRGHDFRGGSPEFAWGGHHRDFRDGPPQFARGDQYRGNFDPRDGSFGFGQRGTLTQRDGFGPRDRQFDGGPNGFPGPRFADRGFGPPPGHFRQAADDHASADVSKLQARIDSLDQRIDTLLHEISQLKHEQPAK